MATKKKLLQAAAGQAGGGAGLNVEEVFSTYLYAGNSFIQTITNGIDLDGEGGLVWIKSRSSTSSHRLYDTERGAGYQLTTAGTTASVLDADELTAFNSNGFSLGSDTTVNLSTTDYASWTFRKAPKFFDVVTYTGDGALERTISHNLGSSPGCVIVKRTDSTGNWFVGHRSYFQSTSRTSTYNGFLHLTNNMNSSPGVWNFTDTTFSVTSINTNISGATYVAYLFAHNDGDGEFGPDGDADIIKCGSYTGTGAVNNTIDIGFEPQWLLVKRASGTAGWDLFDNMRGIVSGSGGTDARLYANATTSENTGVDYLELTPTGINLRSSNTETNGSGDTYIYIAIRRGPMAVPESATDVFAMDTISNTNPGFNSGFPVDMAFWTRPAATEDNFIVDRIRGTRYLVTNSTSNEYTSTAMSLDWSDGFHNATTATGRQAWMWKRAPNYFDVVAYTGTGSNQTISHNLGVAPEFIIVKERTTANNWQCYLEALGNDKRIALNASGGSTTDTTAWQSTTPTDSAFYVGANTQTNVSGEDFIAYLFASLDGVSKVGSYTGNGSTQNIDCGFSAGARFVLIKRTDASEEWHVFDTERGINAGNDPSLRLNKDNAEFTSAAINPYSAGFQVEQSATCNNNVNGGTYIFYAIA